MANNAIPTNWLKPLENPVGKLIFERAQEVNLKCPRELQSLVIKLFELYKNGQNELVDVSELHAVRLVSEVSFLCTYALNLDRFNAHGATQSSLLKLGILKNLKVEV